MAEDIRMLFLKESLNDCEEVYANAVADPKARAWDYLVITAANEAQAQAYRAQVARRQRDARLPKQTRYLVIADPDGKRVGCGGATLNVLREVARLEGGEPRFPKSAFWSSIPAGTASVRRSFPRAASCLRACRARCPTEG